VVESATSGSSQLEPTDFTSRWSVTAFIVKQAIAKIVTMMPVKVISVQGGAGALGAAGTVSVQPLVSLLDGNGNASPHGVINGLPYFRMQGGTTAIIMDPAVGDVGYIHACMRDMSSVVASNGQVSTPGSYRTYDFSDSIYVGGILNATPTQYVQFNSSGVTIADGNGNIITMSSSGIAITGNLTVTGTVIAGYGGADQVGLTTHKHGGVTTGSGTSAAPTAGT
jgi:hypothetical protein